MQRLFLVIGSLSAAMAVAAGAFGAHALKERLDPRSLETFETAVRYQMYHALAIIAVALFVGRSVAATTSGAGGPIRVAGWLFVAGTLLFSGSLYALALSGARWLGPVTPLGGACLLAGWVAFAVAAGRA
ncbi:MAG: DUF423 domain-containing protein [Gemmatimonadaceae bacterium]|nr:DUF423 domain-containing protein [Gemmatimonadaceae bacterium]